MAIRDIRDVLKDIGIGEDEIVSAAMELYFPHPGVETRDKAEARFKQEMDLALSDPNLALLIYAGVLLEEEGGKGSLPNLRSSSYESDLACLIGRRGAGAVHCQVHRRLQGPLSITSATTRPSQAS